MKQANRYLILSLLLSSIGTSLASAAACEMLLRKTILPRKKLPSTHPEKNGLPSGKTIHIYSQNNNKNTKNLTLHGWLIEPTTPKGIVIFTHGYIGNRISNDTVKGLAKKFYQEGFSCLLYDSRTCGESEGSISSLGVLEQNDLLTVTQEALYKYGYQKKPLIYYGYSLGGAISIATVPLAQKKFKDDLQLIGVIADSPFANLETLIKGNIPKVAQHMIPGGKNIAKFFSPIFLQYTKLRGIDLKKMNLTASVSNQNFPLLYLIHSKYDYIIPPSDSVKLENYYNGKGPLMLWLTDAQGHVKSYQENPNTYLSNVVFFITTARKRNIKPLKPEPVKIDPLKKERFRHLDERN